MLELDFGGTATTHTRSIGSKHRAPEMPAREIDRLGDLGLLGKEQATRKQRLIKGSREFRDGRGDQSQTIS